MKLIIAGVALLLLNLTSFYLMKVDKMRARKHEPRISERTLFLSAGLFGAAGGTLAMQIFNHKKNHWNFRAFFPAMLSLQIVFIGFIAYKWLL